MIFMGGKGLWAKKIVAEIEPWRAPGDELIEVCCGAANLTEKWTKTVVAYDLNPALIAMWKATQAGWRPPPREQITAELHKKYKTSPIDPSDPMTAFLLFGCSFRGVWRGGFAHTSKIGDRIFDYVSSQIKSLSRKAMNVSRGVEFVCGSYSDIRPKKGQVVYADPPYASTSHAGIAKSHKALTPQFDHSDFWNNVRQWNDCGALVFTSEESAPDDFIRFRSWNALRKLGNWSEVDRNGPSKLESIWVHRDSAMAAQANGDTVVS